jgi:hypothetical protein
LIIVALAVAGLLAISGGCAFESQIAVQFSPSSPVAVKESSSSELTPNHVQGVTRRAGQVVRVDCSVTVIYDVIDEAGPAVLPQLYRVHLRTRPLPRGTPYEVDCAGPLILEIPADAAGVEATSLSASGERLALPVQAPVTSVPIGFGRRLRAEAGMQFAVVGWPRTLSPGEYRLELAFSLPEAGALREKAIFAASVSCGRVAYLQPLLPLVSKIARAPAFVIQPSAETTPLVVPHIIRANGTYAAATRTLSCSR